MNTKPKAGRIRTLTGDGNREVVEMLPPVEVQGRKVTLRFDRIEIEGRIVRFYLGQDFVVSMTLDHEPGRGQVVTLQGFRGEMDGDLR